MEMQRLPIVGAWLIDPDRDTDHESGQLYRRGHELTKFAAHGLSGSFVHDEVWEVKGKGTLDGVYYWRSQPPALLLNVFRGHVCIGIADLRGAEIKALSVDLDAKSAKQLYLPRGCAVGWVSLQDDTCMQVRYSRYISRQDAKIIAWDDPQLAIPWPLMSPRLTSGSLRGDRLKQLL